MTAISKFRARGLLACVLAPCALALSPSSTLSQPRTTDTTTFACDTSNGSPATVARTPRGDIPILMWGSELLESEIETDPQQECQEVARRFQTYYDSGQLNYITTGRMDGELVACAAEQEKGSCTGKLFALNSSGRPGNTLQRILRIRVPADGPISETGVRTYVQFDKYLNGEYPEPPPPRRRPPETRLPREQ